MTLHKPPSHIPVGRLVPGTQKVKKSISGEGGGKVRRFNGHVLGNSIIWVGQSYNGISTLFLLTYLPTG